jgi:hypothetical protein
MMNSYERRTNTSMTWSTAPSRAWSIYDLSMVIATSCALSTAIDMVTSCAPDYGISGQRPRRQLPSYELGDISSPTPPLHPMLSREWSWGWGRRGIHCRLHHGNVGPAAAGPALRVVHDQPSTRAQSACRQQKDPASEEDYVPCMWCSRPKLI